VIYHTSPDINQGVYIENHPQPLSQPFLLDFWDAFSQAINTTPIMKPPNGSNIPKQHPSTAKPINIRKCTGASHCNPKILSVIATGNFVRRRERGMHSRYIIITCYTYNHTSLNAPKIHTTLVSHVFRANKKPTHFFASCFPFSGHIYYKILFSKSPTPEH
jgi:hypothetical protein